ncbi:MAG: hypothetical protein HY070_02475 [Chloroflexi bacterium]|nr:hypothetical protein [Chloroflexota bacterium]MBI3741347.1 hypothetical protein [Chloroflexota bacterium]
MSTLKPKTKSRTVRKRSSPDRDLEWLANHPEVFVQYSKQWIAIAKGKLIAHGNDLSNVAREAYRVSTKPMFFHVPPDKLLVL